MMSQQEIVDLRDKVKDLDAGELGLDPEYLYGMMDMLQWMWVGVTAPAQEFRASNHTLAKVMEAVQT